MSNDSSPDSPPPKKEKTLNDDQADLDFWDLDAEETTPADPKQTPAKPSGPTEKKQSEKPLPSRKTSPKKKSPSKKVTRKKKTESKPAIEKIAPQKEILKETPKPKLHPKPEQKPDPKTKTSQVDDLGDLEDFKEPIYKRPEKLDSPTAKAQPEKTEPEKTKPVEEITIPEPIEKTKESSPKSSFTKIEKISVAALAAILLLAAVFSIWHFSASVPTEPLVPAVIEMPVTGKLVTITEISTYWREPITTGENRDVIQRGTLLIPAAKIRLTSDSAAIRILFRDQTGLVIGDPITKKLNGKADLEIAATAGFEDKGMHTAYQTGDSPPWIIQIYEVPDASSSRDQLKLILETEISTQLR